MRRLSDERLAELAEKSAEAWERGSVDHGALFHPLLPSDMYGAHEMLVECRAEAETFLELGAGVGTITIMADLLGYDAYGIEILPNLVSEAEGLAAAFQSNATFVEGSFVPVEVREDVDLLSADFLTVTEGADAYEELGMSMRDFDLIFGFPLPGEEDWLAELVRRFAGSHTTFVQFSNRDGFVRTRLNP